MLKLVYVLLFVLFIPMATTHAQVDISSNKQVKHLLEQAQFLAQQGIPHNVVLQIFKEALTQETSSQEPVNALEAQSPLHSKKVIFIVGTLCVIGFAVGSYVMYLACQNDIQQHEELHRNRCEQAEEINRQRVAIFNQQYQAILTAHRNYLRDIQVLHEVGQIDAQSNEPAVVRIEQIAQNIVQIGQDRYGSNLDYLLLPMHQAIGHACAEDYRLQNEEPA